MAFRYPSPSIAWLTATALLFAIAAATSAADWPPISDAERQLTQVSFEPNASAVVISETAHLRFLRYPTEASSRLEVRVRIKILSDEGREWAEIAIPHSGVMRLGEFEGRTVTPDGKVHTLGEDDVFVERRSRARRSFVTKAAFPAVEAGAILDYRYVFFWDTLFYLEPWLFHGDLPKLQSKITYIKPNNLAVRVWGKETGRETMQSNQTQGPHGVELSLWMENLASLPDEPSGFPAEDLASRFMVIPTSVVTSGFEEELLESWETVCRLFDDVIYEDFEKTSRKARRLAKDLTANASSRRQKAEILYRYMRDEVRTLDAPGAWLASDRVDDVIEEQQGNMADQAIVLRRMLDAVKIDAQPTWVGHRNDGRIDASVANPAWFRGTVLRLQLDGETIFLDPSDPTLAFGGLAPGHEGSVAVACDRKEPEIFTLESSAAEANRRRAKIDLTLDAEGRLTGSGEIVHSGQAAWQRLGTIAEDELVSTWTERLERRFEGFDLSAVEVDEEIDAQRYTLRFALSQRDDAVLGDEASWRPAAPLVASQPFTLPTSQRRGPVQLNFASTEDTELTVRWPESWTLDATPEAVDHGSDAGLYKTSVEVDSEAHTLRYTRRFTRSRIDYLGDEAYSALRTLHETASQHDAGMLVWIDD